MKKRSIKKVLALGLAGAMLCGMLTACGGAIEIAWLLGKEETLRRMDDGMARLTRAAQG